MRVCGQLAAGTNQGSLFCSPGCANCLLTFSVVNREKSQSMDACACSMQEKMPIQQLERDLSLLHPGFLYFSIFSPGKTAAFIVSVMRLLSLLFAMQRVFKGGIFPCATASRVLCQRMSHTPHLSFFSELRG